MEAAHSGFDIDLTSLPHVEHIAHLQRLVETRLAQLAAEVVPPSLPLIPMIEEALAGGRRLRPVILLLAAGISEPGTYEPDDAQLDLACAVEILHKASLVHDDLIDHAGARRGEETFHRRYNEELAIVTGDFLLTWAVELTDQAAGAYSAKKTKAIRRTFYQMMRDLAHGELLGLTLSRTNSAASASGGLVSHLLEVNRLKSASLIEGALRIGALLGGLEERADDLAQYGRALGCIFQLKDDLVDLQDDRRAGHLTPALAWLSMAPATLELASHAAGEASVKDWAAHIIHGWVEEAWQAIEDISDTPSVQVFKGILEVVVPELVSVN